MFLVLFCDILSLNEVGLCEHVFRIIHRSLVALPVAETENNDSLPESLSNQ